MHNDFDEQRDQNIRQTALITARKIHVKNMVSMNKNRDLEDDAEAQQVFTEEVIESASMIEEFLKTGDKVYKD